MNQFIRNSLLIGEEKQKELFSKHILLFGIGGVGSYVFESLVRMGIGHITIVDFDIVDITNINRQLIALHSTIGLPKVEVAKKRALDINPSVDIITHQLFVNKDNIKDFDFSSFDFIIDAIDNVEAKLLIIEYSLANNINIISSMGTGNKLDPTKLSITDISKTINCPLARVMRKKLRDKGIYKLPVLASTEIPLNINNSSIIASNSYVPSTGGLLITSYVIKKLLTLS